MSLEIRVEEEQNVHLLTSCKLAVWVRMQLNLTSVTSATAIQVGCWQYNKEKWLCKWGAVLVRCWCNASAKCWCAVWNTKDTFTQCANYFTRRRDERVANWAIATPVGLQLQHCMQYVCLKFNNISTEELSAMVLCMSANPCALSS